MVGQLDDTGEFKLPALDLIEQAEKSFESGDHDRAFDLATQARNMLPDTSKGGIDALRRRIRGMIQKTDSIVIHFRRGGKAE